MMPTHLAFLGNVGWQQWLILFIWLAVLLAIVFFAVKLYRRVGKINRHIDQITDQQSGDHRES